MRKLGYAVCFTVMFVGHSCVIVPPFAQAHSAVWVADLGSGSYKNPILYADYSDPDVVRVGEGHWIDWFRVTPLPTTAPHEAPGDSIDEVAERMLLLQRVNGGWSKSFKGKAVNYQLAFSSADLVAAKKEREALDATIDNKATTQEIDYLVDAYGKTSNKRYADAAKRGVDYLLEAQYPGGGWPQYYPDTRLYRSQITYNDNAIVNVLHVLKAVADRDKDYASIFGEPYQTKAREAIDKAVSCILATQVIIDGQRTIWAAQYDKDTLKPATARAYELPSLATSESARVLLFLMGLEQPATAVRQAIRDGVAWFETHDIEGYTTAIIDDPKQPTGKDRVLITSPGDTVWARFYDLENQEPLFAGRDGIPQRRMEDVENERRVGYAWYGEWGKSVIRSYRKWSPDHSN